MPKAPDLPFVIAALKKFVSNFLKAAMIRKIYKNQRTFTQSKIIHPKQLFVKP